MLSPSIKTKLNAQLAIKRKRLTPTREEIYNVLCSHDEALSMMDIELLTDTIDKSTISRTIHLFLEVGAIHKIDDGTGIFKFATSPLITTEDAPHAHFFCTVCQRTYCLDETTASSLFDVHANTKNDILPEGFICKSISILIKGSCPRCSPRLSKR